MFAMKVRYYRRVPGWFVSFVTHVVLLVLLALVSYSTESPVSKQLFAALMPVEADVIKTFDIPHVNPPEVIATPQMLQSISSTAAPSVEDVFRSVEVDRSQPIDLSDPTAPTEWVNPGSLIAPRGREGRFAMRDPQRRREALQRGGSITSEKAVKAALAWLAQHQRPDGSWSFDHRHGPCKTNAGSLNRATSGATGLALLPFLGAGFTHKAGPYKQQVGGGLAHLVRSMKLNEAGQGQLVDEGNMYSHGICAIALCEAYAMTHDRQLVAPAQAAIDYIAYAQDPVGGGWRYAARQPGDTSVVGWQLMALKSGHLAYLRVPPQTVKGASVFLDSVESQSGSAYGYNQPGDAAGTTSIGLLCRMHLGWKRDHGAIERGVARLAKVGPSKTNLYYNYYATQVVCQYGGESWRQWNDSMRDQLVAAQAKNGTEAGSWYIAGDHGSERGGRVYCTSMATMILEVYYRLQPLYQDEAVEEDFPL